LIVMLFVGCFGMIHVFPKNSPPIQLKVVMGRAIFVLEASG